eukprot:1138963-Pelagomonas_calceolata.AAC.5
MPHLQPSNLYNRRIDRDNSNVSRCMQFTGNKEFQMLRLHTLQLPKRCVGRDKDWLRSLRFFSVACDASLTCPNGTGPSAQHQSRPIAVFVRPIRGKATHLNLEVIPAHDRYIHLMELKYFPDLNPLPSLQTAAAQHAGNISRPRTCSPKNPNANKATLHTILLGMAVTIYNNYTITPLVELGTLYLWGFFGMGATGGQARGGESMPAGTWLITRQTLTSCSPSAPSFV